MIIGFMIEFSGNMITTAQETKCRGYLVRNMAVRKIPFIGNHEMELIKIEMKTYTFKFCS